MVVDAHQTFVIVGGGLAGAKAAQTLRSEGFTGRVILVGEERDHPYERPPLSKAYLTGKEGRASVFIHAAHWYADHDIELHLGQPAIRIDRNAKCVLLGDGGVIHYDKLLLATGADPRPLQVPGSHLAGVYLLRRLPDAARLRGILGSLGRENGRLLIAGAGWIGLEVAAAARGYGVEVTVVETEPTPLHAVLGPEFGSLFTDLHQQHGVRFQFGTRLTEVVGQDGMVFAATTADGDELPAHAVLAAVGVTPRTNLAEAAGLKLAEPAEGSGIAVDSRLRTCDPDIYAAGDVACAEHPWLGRRVRVEHWANALHGGPAAARAMLGQEVVYDQVPYFFSDQYDLGLEYSGFAAPGDYDQVVCRGDVGRREFIGFWLRDGRVLAGMNVNVWDVARPIGELVHAGVTVDPERLSDPSVPLESFLE